MVTDLLFNRFSRVALGIAEEHGPSEIMFVAIFCNGCGAKAVADSIGELRASTSDWLLADHFGGDDFCPRCR